MKSLARDQRFVNAGWIDPLLILPAGSREPARPIGEANSFIGLLLDHLSAELRADQGADAVRSRCIKATTLFAHTWRTTSGSVALLSQHQVEQALGINPGAAPESWIQYLPITTRPAIHRLLNALHDSSQRLDPANLVSVGESLLGSAFGAVLSVQDDVNASWGDLGQPWSRWIAESTKVQEVFETARNTVSLATDFVGILQGEDDAMQRWRNLAEQSFATIESSLSSITGLSSAFSFISLASGVLGSVLSVAGSGDGTRIALERIERAVMGFWSDARQHFEWIERRQIDTLRELGRLIAEARQGFVNVETQLARIQDQMRAYQQLLEGQTRDEAYTALFDAALRLRNSLVDSEEVKTQVTTTALLAYYSHARARSRETRFGAAETTPDLSRLAGRVWIRT